MFLNVNQNRLTELDLSNNPALISLEVSDNRLTELDLSNNPAINILDVSNNRLSELDLSNNHELGGLDASWNLLTSLNVPNNMQWWLRVHDNFINSPDDVTGRNNLFSHAGERDDGGSAFWFYPQRPDNDITSDFVCPVFRDLIRWWNGDFFGQSYILPHHVNQMTELHSPGVSDLAGIQHFTALRTLAANHGDLTEIDLSNNPALEELHVVDNQLTKLDLSNNPALRTLHASRNQLTELDLSNNPALNEIRVTNNQLTALDVSNNPSLVWLYAQENKLTGLDIRNNNWLITLHIHDNFINSPDDIIGWNSRFSTVGERGSGAFQFYPQNEPPPPPLTGISDITRPAAIMLAFLALSAALWVYVLRRKFVRG
jgi:stage V sporulation protein SpoVS